MRERLDFSSISQMLLKYRKTSRLSYAEYYETLFSFAFDNENIKIPTPDNTNINKIIAGERNVSKDIIDLCLEEDGKTGLAQAMESILECLSDPEKAVDELETLLWNDSSISSKKKTELCNDKSSAIDFIVECLVFALSRSFISRSKKAATLQEKTFTLSDFNDKPNTKEELRFQEHYHLFKMLSDDALVILDNFNALPEDDALLEDFLSLSFYLIITTRNAILDEPCYNVQEISSDADLMELFYAHSPRSKEQPEIVAKIIEEVYRHTLTVEMAAKTITASGITAEQLLCELQKDRLGLSNPNQIRVKKDEKTKRDTLQGHLETLFRLQAFSPMQQVYLQSMQLVPISGISKALYLRLLKADNANTLNELIDYGWIKEDMENSIISMHPFLCEVVQHFTL